MDEQRGPLAEQIGTLTEQIGKLDGKLNKRKGKLLGKGGNKGTQNIIIALNAVRTSIQSLQDKAEQTNEKTRTRINKLDARLNALVRELERAGVRHNQVEQLARNAANSVTHVEKMKGDVKQDTKVITDAMDAIHADLVTTRVLLASVEGDMHHKFEQLEKDLYQQISDIVERFGVKMQQESKDLEKGMPKYERLPDTSDSSGTLGTVLGTDMLHGRRAIALKF